MNSATSGGSIVLYRVVRAVVLRVCALTFRVRIRGRANIPPWGAYVLAPSHRSLLDIVFLGYVTPRRIRFMGKAELFKLPVFGPLFRSLGGFPVERGATDRGALKSALAVLEAGEPLAIYPEGTRASGPALRDLFEGPAYVALKRGVPIVPVGIGGSEEILPSGASRPRFERVAVVVGAPISVPKLDGTVRRSDTSRLTEELRVALQRAFDEANVLRR